jgi:isoaspartyl peptidase/L-asparaginase-like protein (Ntn-hydrolase superfamily)
MRAKVLFLPMQEPTRWMHPSWMVHIECRSSCGVKHIKNPIDAAIEVMNNSPHVMMSGAGAETICEIKRVWSWWMKNTSIQRSDISSFNSKARDREQGNNMDFLEARL